MTNNNIFWTPTPVKLSGRTINPAITENTIYLGVRELDKKIRVPWSRRLVKEPRFALFLTYWDGLEWHGVGSGDISHYYTIPARPGPWVECVRGAVDPEQLPKQEEGGKSKAVLIQTGTANSMGRPIPAGYHIARYDYEAEDTVGAWQLHSRTLGLLSKRNAWIKLFTPVVRRWVPLPVIKEGR